MSPIWNVTGTQFITVTATNDYGTARDTHMVTINDPSQGSGTLIYLPIVIKDD